MKNELTIKNVIEYGLITTVFQPILDLEKACIIGYEAFSRGPEQQGLLSPITLIETAKREGIQLKLESHMIKKVIEIAQKLENDKPLFINIDPNVLILDSEFLCQNAKHNIVIELTAHDKIVDRNKLKKRVKELKKIGYKISVGDIGNEHADLMPLEAIRPNYIKFDKDIVKDIDTSIYRQQILRNMVLFAQMTGAVLIVEGIEKEEQLRTVIKLGANVGQGYFFQRPDSTIKPIDEDLANTLLEYQYAFNPAKVQQRNSIGEICEKTATFDYQTPTIEIKDYLKDTELEGVCLTKGDKPIGLVMKNHLDAVMSLKYGYSVFSHRAAGKIMDESCLFVDYLMPIQEVAKLAMARPNQNIYDMIIVVKDTKYFGTVTILNLLRFLNSAERKKALQCNPLSGLPGNDAIEEQIILALNSQEECCLLYFDLDHFKPFNDTYGFSKGDEMIRLTCDIICTQLKKRSFVQFLGHLGGDDFVAIVYADYSQCEELCSDIVEAFEEESKLLFKESDRQRGYYIGKGRDGMKRQYSLTGISIAGIYGNMNILESKEQIGKKASQLKSQAKKINGSAFIIRDIKFEPKRVVSNLK